MQNVYTIEPGRHIYRNGEKFISIGREGETYPGYADAMAEYIAKLLNEQETDPRAVYEARVARMSKEVK
jgi:hypothetical protein